MNFRDFLKSLVRKTMGLRASGTVGFMGTYRTECYDKDGNLKWVDETTNKIPTAGLNWLLGGALNAAQASYLLYLGLISSASPTFAAADTSASHAGWTELTGMYSQGTRPLWGQGAAAAGAVTNSSAAVFSMTGTCTVSGAFVSTLSTIGGSTGTIVSEYTFSQGNKACSNGDTINVTYTISATSVN